MSRFDSEIPPRRVAAVKRKAIARCVGCGKFYAWPLCRECKALQDCLLERVAKLWGTLENRFAARRA